MTYLFKGSISDGGARWFPFLLLLDLSGGIFCKCVEHELGGYFNYTLSHDINIKEVKFF